MTVIKNSVYPVVQPVVRNVYRDLLPYPATLNPVLDLSREYGKFDVSESGGDEYVNIWKDYANDNDAEQTTGAYRPILKADGVEFDGVDDYLDVGDISNVDFGDGNFAISVWVNIAVHDTRYVIVGKDDDTDGRQIYFATRDDDNIIIQYYVSSNKVYLESDVDSIGINSWQHIIGQRVGDSFEIYVNGNLVKSGTTDGTHGTMDTTNAQLNVGRRSYLGFEECLNGSISAIRIFDRALTETEIGNLYDFNRNN
jgi:hypothetical protein